MNRPEPAPARPALMPDAPLSLDPLIGRDVEVRSTGGMQYRGVIRSIRIDADLGELFELGSRANAGYRRLVYVTDRGAQIRAAGAED